MAGKLAVVASTLFVLSLGFQNTGHGTQNETSKVSHKKDAYHTAVKVHGLRDENIEVMSPKDVTSIITSTSITILHPATIKSATLEVIEGSTTVMPTIVTKPVEKTWQKTTVESSRSTTTTTIADAKPVCGAQDRDLIDSCLAKTLEQACDENDSRCLCNKYKSREVCFVSCSLDARLAEVSMEKNKYCNMAFAMPTPPIKVDPLATQTQYKATTRLVATEIREVPPFATKIIYSGEAGTVTVWTGKAGHTHIPTIVGKMMDGTVKYRTINARPTNAAADLRGPGLAAVVGGAIGLVAAVL